MGSCRACDYEAGAEDRFCRKCGSSLAAEVPAEAPVAVPVTVGAPLAGERLGRIVPVPGEPWRRGGPAPWTGDIGVPGAQARPAAESAPGWPADASNGPPPTVGRVRLLQQASRHRFRAVAVLVAVATIAVTSSRLVQNATRTATPANLAWYMANGGVDYAPNELHYRVTLPLRPRESETIDTTGNRPAPVHVADIEDTQYQMQLSEEALTAVPAHADVYPYLQRVAQQMERVFNATQPSETRFVHEGLPAVQAVAKSGAWQFDAAVVYSGGRVYRITVRTQKGGREVLTQVLSSFHVDAASP